MFPNVTFLQLDLYDWCFLIGIVLALVVFRMYADKKKLPVKLQNTCLIIGAAAILVGYGSAILFQAIYDFAARGEFVIDLNTGATFYGGLIGGAAAFIALYWTVARKLCGVQTVKDSWQTVTGIASCSIAIAHAVGRVGCFMDGCCYGKVTDSWIGIYMPAVGEKVIPTQMFEFIFLFILFAALTFVLFRTKISGLGIYLTAYGVFRFIIEFWRADDRGASVIPALSPSQLWAIVLTLLGAALIVLTELLRRKRSAPSTAPQEEGKQNQDNEDVA